VPPLASIDAKNKPDRDLFQRSRYKGHMLGWKRIREKKMQYPFPADLQAMVGERMKAGAYVSEDELLRDALRALAEEEEDLRAVQDALDEWRAGDHGMPLDAAFAAVRNRRHADNKS
jgi:putative addiction module CopG family antidote